MSGGCARVTRRAVRWLYLCKLPPPAPTQAAPHTNSTAMPPAQLKQYDYSGALASLSQRISALSALQQQSSVPPTRLGATWAFLRANRSSAALLMVMYSISTASVAGAIMAEHRLQSDVLLEGREQETLQQEIARLQQHVQEQQAVLQGLQQDLQTHFSSDSGRGGWWLWRRSAEASASAARQAMARRLQQYWGHDGSSSSSSTQQEGGGSPQHAGSRQQQQRGDDDSRCLQQQQQEQQQQQRANQEAAEFGVRVGPMGGRGGFLI